MSDTMGAVAATSRKLTSYRCTVGRHGQRLRNNFARVNLSASGSEQVNVNPIESKMKSQSCSQCKRVPGFQHAKEKIK